MTHRVLPPADWPRLNATDLRGIWPMLQPDRARVIVVEDAQGVIVGCWAFLQVLHGEGVYIAQEHRSKGAVARHLLAGMRETAAVVGAQTVWTGADDPTVAGLLEKLGAQRVPYDSYVIPMTRGES